MEYVHGAPACVTLNVWPPTVNVPVRGARTRIRGRAEADAAVAAAARAARHRQPSVLLLTPVQAHPFGAATAVEPVPPVDATDWLGGVNV